MGNFCLLNRNLFKLPEEIETFWKFAWKNRNYLVKLPEKIEIFRKFAWKYRIFLPGSTTPQISNQIDAADCTTNTTCDSKPRHFQKCYHMTHLLLKKYNCIINCMPNCQYKQTLSLPGNDE